MDQAYVSTLSALAGTLIGGVTSFATSWLTQTAQAREARLAAERSKRETLYGQFIDDLAVLFSHALSSDKVDYAKLVASFALKNRIVLLSSPPVVASAEAALKFVVDLYMGPALPPPEVRRMMEDRASDPIGAFAQVCRQELQTLRVP